MGIPALFTKASLVNVQSRVISEWVNSLLESVQALSHGILYLYNQQRPVLNLGQK